MTSIDTNYINIDKQSLEKLTEKKLWEGAKLSYHIYKDSLILPHRDGQRHLGGVVDNTGYYIDNSNIYEERNVGSYECNQENIEIEHSSVSYLGSLLKIYGHAITDNIKKTWILLDNSLKDNIDKIVYISDWDGETPHHVKEIFRLLSIDLDRCEKITLPTIYDRVIVPDNSFIHHNNNKYYTHEFKKTIDKIKKNSSTNKTFPTKIYLTRRFVNDGWRRDYGEYEIEKVFTSLGYNAISPQEYSIEDQIHMMINCKSLVSTEGSISHNSMFCSCNTKLVLLRKADVINIWQAAINQIAELDVTYVDIHKSIRTNKTFPMIGPFYMYITTSLEKYVGHKIIHCPLWLKPSWYFYYYQIDNTSLWQKYKRCIKSVHRYIQEFI